MTKRADRNRLRNSPVKRRCGETVHQCATLTLKQGIAHSSAFGQAGTGVCFDSFTQWRPNGGRRHVMLVALHSHEVGLSGCNQSLSLAAGLAVLPHCSRPRDRLGTGASGGKWSSLEQRQALEASDSLDRARWRTSVACLRLALPNEVFVVSLSRPLGRCRSFLHRENPRARRIGPANALRGGAPGANTLRHVRVARHRTNAAREPPDR